MKYSLAIIVVVLMINNVLGKCPVPKKWVKKTVQDQELLGKWYTIATNYLDEYEVTDCPYFMYTESKDLPENSLIASIHGFSHMHDDEVHSADFSGVAEFGDHHEAGTWIEKYAKKDYYGHEVDDEGTPYEGQLEFKTWALMINKNVAVIYSCHEEEAGTFTEFVDVVARKPLVFKEAEDLVNKAVKVVSDSGLTGVGTFFKQYDQLDCK